MIFQISGSLIPIKNIGIILTQLKTNKEFIIENVNKDEFKKFINFFENYRMMKEKNYYSI